MPRHKTHVVAKRKQLLTYRCQQRCVIAARKIGATNRALEQHITDKGELRVGLVKHYMAGRVARTMQHLETQAAHLHRVAVVEPLIRAKCARRRKPEQFGLMGQQVKPELLFTLRPDDGDAERLAQFCRSAHVVEMAMGKQNFFQLQPTLCHLGQQPFGFTTGVDQRGVTIAIPHERAVLLIRGNGENGKFHTAYYHAPLPFNQSQLTLTMPTPDALLLISTHCPHCPVMLAALADLVKQGVIGRLEAVNLEQHPELGQALGVRSVPWVRIGRIELAGVHSPTELANWATKADSETGMADYFHMLLKTGQLLKAQSLIETNRELLAAVLPIVGNVDASLNVRLGAGVLLENFAGTESLRALLPRLGGLSQREDARIRADACHYLGLTADVAARPWLDARLADEDADVREIAAESLQMITG